LATFTDNATNKFPSVINNSYTISNITANHAITATFSMIPPIPVNGACGNSNGKTLNAAPTTDLCSTGTPSIVTGTGPWNWSCSGSNGGITTSCSAFLAKAPFALTITTKPLSTPLSYNSKTGIITFTVTGTATVLELEASTSTSDSWILKGTLTFAKGKGTFKYTVIANTSSKVRQGSISIGGQSYAISQTGMPSKLTLTPSSTNPLSKEGGSMVVGVAIYPADGSWKIESVKWTPITATDWLHGFSAGIVTSGNSSLSLTADANSTGKPRGGVFTLLSSDGKSKKTVTVKQAK
jgi:hypothetical protein